MKLAIMRPPHQMADQVARDTGESLPSDYIVQLLDYPTDLDQWLEATAVAFANDPNTVYLDQHIKNPKTIELRKHMRRARFRNQIEGLNPGGQATDGIFAKLMHIPTDTIVGVTGWTFPTNSVFPKPSDQPAYPLLPHGVELPIEDAALSSLGPRLEEDIEKYINTIPLLGESTEARNKEWWYLAMLGVIPSHSGKRLGAKVVQWGLAMAREDAKRRPSAGIKGAWLTATEAGLKTYVNVGFKIVGQCRVLYGSLHGDGPGWRIADVNDETMAMQGQMCYVLAMEF